MGRANVVQTNFTSGEVSPRLYGRIDVNKYFNGARKLLNFLVWPQGGITRRSGTRFVNETKDSTKRSILHRFIFSESQAFILEFGDLYVRFYQDGGRIESPVGTPVAVVTPYLEADLDQLYFTQSADVIYIAHPSYQTRKLSRTSNTSWTLSLYDPDDGPYLDRDTSGITLQVKPLGTTNEESATMYANFEGSQTVVATGGTPFTLVTDVGKYVEFRDANGFWTLGLITAVASTSQATVTPADSSIIKTHDTVTFGGGQVHATRGGTADRIFGSSSVGLKVRLSASQAWYTVTAVSGISADATATAFTNIVSYNTAVITITLNAGFITGTDEGKYIEYRDTDQWALAKILTVIDYKSAYVKPIDQVFRPNPAAKITFTSPRIDSDLSGVFTPRPGKNMFIRSDAGAWYKLGTYVSSTRWDPVTAVTTKSYSYPTFTMVVKDRTNYKYVEASSDLFLPTDVGRWLRLQFGAQVRWGKINVVWSPTLITFLISDQDDFPKDDDDADKYYNNGTADAFQLGAWSDTTGWPAVVSFHEQRLWFFRTTTQPQTAWGTRSGDYESQAPTEQDLTVVGDSAVNYTIASNRVNPVQWAETGPVLLVGTLGSEYQIKATSLNEPITPTNVDIKEQTRFGSISTMRPHRIGSSVLFAQRGGMKLREMTYDYTIDAFVSKDLSILSEHILRNGSGAFKTAYQQEPISTIWIVMNDGNLAAITYERDQDVVAWHRHQLSGGFVESVMTVPSSTGRNDYVYLIVRRTINGSTKRYIEYLEVDFNTTRGDSVRDCFFVDCGLTYSGVAATTISGLSHLEGATVQVFSEGAYVGTKVVASGAITLLNATTKASIGLPIRSVLTTLDPEGGSPAGTSQGKRKRIAQVDIRVIDSFPFKVGPDENSVQRIVQDDFKEIASRDIRVTLDQSYDGGGRFSIVQDEPVPLNVLAIMPQLNTNE